MSVRPDDSERMKSDIEERTMIIDNRFSNKKQLINRMIAKERQVMKEPTQPGQRKRTKKELNKLAYDLRSKA